MKQAMKIGGRSIPVRTVNTVIVGAGAAAMNCAVKLVEFWREKGVDKPHERLLVVTGGLPLGASRMSGSDKQTYYKMGTSPRVPDTAEDFAKTLMAFGCCNGDTALAEGIGSLRGFYHLVEAGVPFPHDPCGAFIGYKTDHDPYERATSAGPKTSKFMSQCLQAKAQRLGVRIVDKRPVVDFVTAGEGDQRRIVAMVCFDAAKMGPRRQADDLQLEVFVAENWVLAAGGPGEIYKDTVYPKGQIGIHGPALKAGLEACNLTESQYGLASIKFRWNVSGTYMQVIPRIFSTDANGADQREFLTDYFPDMASMASNIFLKGYQWPFDAQRITCHQSSLIDMAVHVETAVRGRRVWMDFLRNPLGSEGWAAFDFAGLSIEARQYLQKAGALQQTPIERLAHMNTPAIEIYAENGIDLFREPLEIAICAQHNNGGFAVNAWWESNVKHVFVVGEMAGTHGVKRPGGSALNAGQVGALRAAEYIAGVYGAGQPKTRSGQLKQGLASIIKDLKGLVNRGKAAATPHEAMAQIRRRMTCYGAHLRWRAGAEMALAEALKQCRQLIEDGLKVASSADLLDAVQARQQCLTHAAFLKAIAVCLAGGAGSRGSHCVLDEQGVQMHPALVDADTGRPYRFKAENEALRNSILHLRHNPLSPDSFDVREVAPRPLPRHDLAFEVAWAQYRQGAIFDL